MIISAQADLSNPNPAICELALQTLCINTEYANFVDGYPESVAAAERIGLRAFWLVRTQIPWKKIFSVYSGLTQIRSLTQAIPFVQGQSNA